MRRSFLRGGGVLAAAALAAVMAAGPVSAASSSSSTTSTKLKAATLNGTGSTFQLGFNQVVIGAFRQQQKAVTINYQGVGSGQGRTDFANKVTDFGGTDAPYATGTAPADLLYFPTVIAPITISYNLDAVKSLQLSADTAAKIFQAQITNWNDPAIKADNPKAKLPNQTITVVHRTEGSGTTQNFTNWLVKAAPTTWTLGTGSTVQWPATTQGAQGNPGVGSLIQETPGAIGYVDLSDADALDLHFAAVKNASGKFIAPTLSAASAAVNATTVNPDLTFDPINASGAKAYPLTSPTWIMVYGTQTDAKKGAALKGWLAFIYGTSSGQGQTLAETVDYAPLPTKLLQQAKAQLSKIIIPAA
jgi:phosphate transport system substrate-binding protein